MPLTRTGFDIVAADFVSLQRKLERMADSSESKKIRMKALKAGARVVRDGVKEEINKVDETDLRQSGKTRFGKSLSIQQRSNKKDFGEVVVGPAYSGKKYIAPEFHIFEFGTVERVTSSGASRGRIAPLGMFRRGWERKRNEAQAEVANTLKELLNVAT